MNIINQNKDNCKNVYLFAVIIFAWFMGFMPLSFEDGTIMRFKWKSFSTWYSIVVLNNLIARSIILSFRFFTEDLSFRSFSKKYHYYL